MRSIKYLSLVFFCTLSIFSSADDEFIENFSTHTTRPFLEVMLYDKNNINIADQYTNYLDMIVLQLFNEPNLKLEVYAYMGNASTPEEAGKICEQRLNIIKDYFITKGIISSKIILINKNIQDLPAKSMVADNNLRNNFISFKFF